MQTQNIKTAFKLSLKIILSLLVLLCICISTLYLYVVPFRNWDAKVCSQRISKELSIEPNMGALYKYMNTYLKNNLYVGMSRDDAIEKLREAGPIRIDSISVSDGYRDTVWIKYCILPINYIQIIIWYDADKYITIFGLSNN